jgi:predicted AAA+ superfamily ATPase
MPTTAAEPASEGAAGIRSAAALERIAGALERLAAALPPARQPEWAALAHVWRRDRGRAGDIGGLDPVWRLAAIRDEDLLGIEFQKGELLRNTAQFVRGLPANNVLLTGARGTGKSSLVRACLQRYAADGLRLIEVDKQDLGDLARIADQIAGRPERFIVFCDDLSFEAGEGAYKALKAALDGSVAAASDKLLIYATSNRRHLLPEAMRENLEARLDEAGDLHPGETTEEKVSLSERFGLWLPFRAFNQDDYLAIVAHCLARHGLAAQAIAQARLPALQFALQRGSRSGRVAAQFARDHAGALALGGGAQGA